jgi:hypothetical protein
VQRLYQFAVQVWPGPSDSPFRFSRLVTVRSKLVLLNDTGLELDFKQAGTPDPGSRAAAAFGSGRRFSGRLKPGDRWGRRCPGRLRCPLAPWLRRRAPTGDSRHALPWAPPLPAQRALGGTPAHALLAMQVPGALGPRRGATRAGEQQQQRQRQHWQHRPAMSFHPQPACKPPRPQQQALTKQQAHLPSSRPTHSSCRPHGRRCRPQVIRPASGGWLWSGSFPLLEREEYKGLRIRHRGSKAAYKIIPVNTTVGAGGVCGSGVLPRPTRVASTAGRLMAPAAARSSPRRPYPAHATSPATPNPWALPAGDVVLVTFKSEASLAPYRIENRCREVFVYLRQREARGAAAAAAAAAAGGGELAPGGSEHRNWDELGPQSSLPFAWDEPSLRHSLLVQAACEVGGRPARLCSRCSGGWPLARRVLRRPACWLRSAACPEPAGRQALRCAEQAQQQGSSDAAGAPLPGCPGAAPGAATLLPAHPHRHRP